ncbi:MAG: DEAD/DEAH box helicase [Chitinophagales bacterium]|nr:DEAD/DEAH box helicase [Chitinophagaceae bacterium]MCB9063531.1 DEAD/DEAH box helicase [Chitinophagales bacterium]
MSLPPLLRHVYNHGTEEVIRRGKRIFFTSGVQLLDVDHLLEQVRFRVRNDIYQNYYTVTVNKYVSTEHISVRCQCPYNLGEICRHEVAALFQLNDLLQSGFFENADIKYDQKHTVIRMRQVNMQMLRVFTSNEIMEEAEQWATKTSAIITEKKNDRVKAEVPDGDETYKVIIRRNEERYFDTSCGCDEQEYPICVHKATLFLQILNAYGHQYFQNLQDWDQQKNKLLGLYGYSLDDDLTGKFEFTYDNGKPFLRVLDPSIKKVSSPANLPVKQEEELIAAETETLPQKEEPRLGIVLDRNTGWYPFLNVALVSGITDDREQGYPNGVDHLDLQQYINAHKFRADERELVPIARKFHPVEILKYLKKNLPFGEFYDDYKEVLKEMPAEDVKDQLWEYLLPKYQKLLDRYSHHPLCFTSNDKRGISSKTIEAVEFTGKKAHPQLSVNKKKDGYAVELSWNIDDTYHPFEDVEVLNNAILQHDFKLYALGNLNELRLFEEFLPDGKIDVSVDDWDDFLREKLMKWSQMVHVNFSEEIIERVSSAKPKYRLYLQEREQKLVMKPAFLYGGVEIKWGFFGDVIEPKDGVVKIIQRNEEAEQDFITLLRNLHTDMHQNLKEHFFFIVSGAVLAQNWFFRFMEEMKEWNVELHGFESLKNLRINTNKPETRLHVTSGIDWFDTSVDVVFGDQSVTIAQVKRALTQKQNFIKLGDGSIGLLPDEWLKKYALLIKMGEEKSGKLRLKKFHFSVLDEMLQDLDEDAMIEELERKKERLENIIDNKYDSFDELQAPMGLKANLRPYQLSGFRWLVFLKETGLGGILADDMGLGKTVQALALFLHYKDSNPNAKFFVACPTTLIYNWENEIKKFAPQLTYHIHHGPKRASDLQEFDPYDVIITTYGTMRSDIKMIKEIPFDYALLDESQSIKNPQAQVAKAALLLNAKNRVALSGTPVQNNTFDLYAQLNFLNPGILGSREFFMNEFATPIDKFQEREIVQQLRKLTYPYILRRTKEQVAKDLPEKTETLLVCEMGNEQRKIYDSYRNIYKSQILGMIEEKGIERSQMHILQGLTKLRQICDSPAILNEEEKLANHSVKLDELAREITENVGKHKALVFSQFLGMLGLIREELEKQNIPFAYFDGSTTATQREQEIQKFQQNDDCRVFLISLKAGGIGLNLTAADYVYIVDPWWNPAVEQQAIDRTHRIGQTKNIFAYRLICKDTIEEKMLQLQERKRALASDLVSEDNAFLKKLTKEDITFLFS